MTEAGTPMVSVCMPVYLCEKFIFESIQSVLNQCFPDFELIVIDNASPDDTYRIASEIKDSRLRVYRNDTNLGLEGNWNKVLSLAKGRYVKLLPGDDTIYPDCLQKQVEVLENESNRDVVLVYCARDIIDAHGRKVLRAKFAGEGRIDGDQLVRKTLRYGTNIIGEPGAVLFRREVGNKVGPIDSTLGYVTDLDYWVRLLRLGAAYAIPEALCTFRLSGENWSVRLGHERRRQFVRFAEKLATLDRRISRLDLLLSKFMAHINEMLRVIVYKQLIGIGTAHRN
ncbi:MAG TPA: glycosyltransferase family 2 protein [Parasulfuritortus sp.]